MTKDGRDFYCGAKLVKLCKLPADFHELYPNEANSIIERAKVPYKDKIGVQPCQ